MLISSPKREGFHQLAPGIKDKDGKLMPIEQAVYEWERRGLMSRSGADSLVKHLRIAAANRAKLDGLSAGDRAAMDAAERKKREEEQNRQAFTRALIDARIPMAMHTANFDTTENGAPLTILDGNKKAHHWTRELALRWVKQHKGLTLSGPSGCGKTYLATAALVEIIRQHGRVTASIMVTERELLQAFRQSYNRRADDPYTPSTIEVRERFVVRPDVLVLDDFGAEEPSASEKGDWARGQIMDLVEFRTRERKTTIVTTNLTEAEIGRRYDNRICSRLTGHSPWFDMMIPADFRQTVIPNSDDPFAGEDIAALFNTKGGL